MGVKGRDRSCSPLNPGTCVDAADFCNRSSLISSMCSGGISAAILWIPPWLGGSISHSSTQLGQD